MSAGNQKLLQTNLLFLPTGHGMDVPEERSGVIQLDSSADDGLRRLSDALPDSTARSVWMPDPLAIVLRMEKALRADDDAAQAQTAAWRGLLALCLLWDGWTRDGSWPSLTYHAIHEDDGRLSAALMTSVMETPVPWQFIALVRRDENGEQAAALGLAGGSTAVVPAAVHRAGTLMPPRVTWYSDENGFTDPSRVLDESDRTRLIGQLDALASSPALTGVAAIGAFADDLRQVRGQERRRVLSGENDAAAMLRTRFAAALSLGDLPAFDQLTVQEEDAARLRGVGELLKLYGCSGIAAPDTPADPRRTWCWRGVPIAWESREVGFEATNAPGEAEAIADLSGELSLLERNSAAWNGCFSRALTQWLNTRPDGQELQEGVKPLVTRWRDEAAAKSNHPEDTVTLTWPWQADEPAIRTLTEEAFPSGGAQAAASPFSDKLVLLENVPATVLADTALREHATVIGSGAVALPPLSAAMAAAAQAGLVEPEEASFHYEASAGGAVTVSFEAAGVRRVRWQRTYATRDVLRVSAGQIPTISVWPCVRFSDSSWREYHVYAHEPGELRVTMLEHGEAAEMKRQSAGADRWALGQTTEFPAWVLLSWQGASAGAVPNLVEAFIIRHQESAVIGLDFGTTGTSVVIRQGDSVVPMGSPSLQRILLSDVEKVRLEDEFIPQARIEPILFSSEDAFTDDVSAWRQPLVDGHIYTPLSFDAIAGKDPGRLYYDLKWGIEPFRESINRLFLNQVMTTASLIARMNGAPDCAWRVAMPGAMARDGRASYLHIMQELARETAERTGLGLTPGVAPVSYATESLAASMYFRSRSEVNVRGGFVMIDVGGGTAELSLWLRGMKAPAITCSLPLGSQFMLLDSLLEHPSQLEEDFGGMSDAAALHEMRLLPDQLRRARGSLRLLQKCRFMLDAFVGQHMDALSQTMNETAAAGGCTRTQALLLLNFSFLMMLAGQLEERAFRDSTINHLLAPRMQICVSGRGSLLMMGLDNVLLSRLHRFVALPMSPDHPTREHVLVVSGSPKMEVATGLTHLTELLTGEPEEIAETSNRGKLAWQPTALMAVFLETFRREFPAAAQVLFPNLYGAEGHITPEAVGAIQMIAENSFVNLDTSDPIGYAATLAGLRGRVGW